MSNARQKTGLVRVGSTFLVLAALAAALTPASLNAQGRFLAKEDILLYGVGLRVEPAEQTVPKDIATIVSTFLQAPNQPGGNLPPFAPDAVVKATLRGPGIPTPLELSVQPNSPFNIPPLTVAGTYTLDDIRLVSNGQVLLRSTPESARITVIEKLLVTQITARPLTADEIRKAGIVFDKSNFQAFNFTAAFAIQNKVISIQFPVVLPTLQGASDVTVGQVGIPSIQAPALQSLSSIIPDTLSIQTQVPNLSVVGFTLQVPTLNGQQFVVPPIPGVIVIPGDIGFLDQFFSVLLMVSNVAPAGSSLVVSDLTASIVLPPGKDGAVGSTDDPLLMALTTHGPSPRVQPVTQPGADGQLGTADDITTLGPGQTGNAEFLVEGKREGSHIVEMRLAGTLNGLPVGPVPITGQAAGAVLVRNPSFTLTFTHPDVVTAGEAYTLDVTVTNTSAVPANFVSVNLFDRNLSGATLVGSGSKGITSILPGDSGTVTFDLISKLSGKVTSATLDSDQKVAGIFELKHAIGELGVPLSPDSLVLPKEANSLPKSLRDAAIGLLGKAYAVATAPPAALPPAVKRFSRKIVYDRAVEVAEAGLRTTLHETLRDSASQLAMDFIGSNFSRLPERNPKPDDLQFARDDFNGFDELRRQSIRGDVFAQAVANLLAPDLLDLDVADFHRDLAQKISYRPDHISVLIGTGGTALPFTLTLVDAQNRRLGTIGDNGKIIKEIPFSDHLTFKDANGTAVGQMAILAAPTAGDYSIRLDPVPGAPAGPIRLSIVVPRADGTLRHIFFNALTGDSNPALTFTSGDPYRLHVVLGDEPVSVTSDTALVDPAPSIVGVVQQASADQLKCDVQEVNGIQAGRVVAVLFSEEITLQSAQDRLRAEDITNYLPEANKVVGVALQPGRRIVFLALRDPYGPFIPRKLTIDGITDLRGHVMASQTVPMESTITENGGVVSGHVYQADGTPVPFANVRLFSRIECNEPAWVGISSKSTDEGGGFQWDFVLQPLLDRIVAVDPETEEFRDVRFNVQGNGQQLKVDIVLLGRGTLQGRTLDESGKPLRNTSVRITSLTDQSQYGATSDGEGKFAVARIPVGNLLIEAVNVAANARTFVAENIPLAGATTTRDIVLLSEAKTQVTVKHGTLSGHVYRNDGVTPVKGVPVIVYYASNSQPGVTCDVAGECAVALTNTDDAGRFAFQNLVAGTLRITTFDQSTYQQGEARTILAADANLTVNVLLGAGLGTVHGIVLDGARHGVAGARVGGGLSLTTTDADGKFTLTDVPVGHASIVAVSDQLKSRGTADVDIVRAGEEVNVTIVLESTGGVAGVVHLADGSTPARNIKVYLFKRAGGSIIVTGTATTDDQGRYSMTNVPLGDYTVSAFRSDFSDGNVAPAPLKFFNQVVKADITFRGGNGKVTGRVLAADGATPLRARVSVSGDQVLIAGGQVGVGFQYVQNFKIVDSNLTTGTFTLGGIWVGPFAVRAAGQFSPDPVTLEGTLPAAGATVQMDLKLQPTSQVSGRVLLPDGVTAAGANIVVRYKSDEFKVICTSGGIGEDNCTTIPQGIQEEVVVTDAAGTFGLPLVNAGSFTVTVEDQATGKTGQVHGSVKAGEDVNLSIRLVGLGEIALRVLGSDGTTPIPGAKVEIEQIEYPRKKLTAFAGPQGTLTIAGGDSFTEGSFVVTATDVSNGFSGRAAGKIGHDGEHVAVNVFLFNQSGTVIGTVFRSDGLTPVPNAEVVVGGPNGPIAFTLSDSAGAYRVERMPLGPVSVDVFEAATARRGFASGQVDLDHQEVAINVREAALGVVRGTVLDNGTLVPLKGWEVDLTQTSPAGRSLPSLKTMSSIDGTFSLPGVSEGTVTLLARKDGINGSGAGSGAIEREGQVVDIPLLAKIVRPVQGGIQGRVLNPDGSAAPNVAIDICPDGCFDAPLVSLTAGADGTFGIDHINIGRYEVRARAQVGANVGRAYTQLSFEGETAGVTVEMAGSSQITGQVVKANGSAASNVQVQLEGNPGSGCSGPCTKFADGSGNFTFDGVPARTFNITAVDPVSGLKGIVGDSLIAGETKTVRIVLEPTGVLRGRTLLQNASPASGVVLALTSGVRHLFTQSGADGAFIFPTTPIGAYTLTLTDPVGNGIASRAGTISGTTELGDIRLDETPPAVGTIVPAPDATGVALQPTIRITFTEKVAAGGIDQTNITLSDDQGDINGTVGPVGDTGATYTPLSPLREATRYTVRVKGITDLAGKPMTAAYIARFTTIDQTAPAYVDVSPAQNTSGAPIYTVIRIQYSEPIDPTKFTTPAILVTSPAGAVNGRIDYSLGNSVAVFTPALPLNKDVVYRVQVSTASDVSGNQQAQGLDYTFSTTDSTAPHLIGLTAPATVVENGFASVKAEASTGHDVAFVDFFINDGLVGSSRSPFTLNFQAIAAFGHPGDKIKISARATDTSGNRGLIEFPTFVTVVADQAPSVTITSPANGLTAQNGERIAVTVKATDDLGITQQGFKAQTGNPQDAALKAVNPPATERTETFGFNVPANAAPGATILIEASAADTFGHVGAATPVAITVLDSVGPTVTITGATTGDKIKPGQQTTAVVSVHDLGGVQKINFSTTGVVAVNDSRTLDPAQPDALTSFTFQVPATAKPGDSVTLRASAVDKAGNIGTAADVILPVADGNGPTLTLKTPTGSLDMIPGEPATVIAQASDSIAVTRIELTGSGAFPFSDVKQVSPPTGDAQAVFTINVPDALPAGAVLNLQARAFDSSNNVSSPAFLSLTAKTLLDIELPASAVVKAGSKADVIVRLPAGGPAAGQLVTFTTEDEDIATVTAAVTFAAGETTKTIKVEGQSGGTVKLSARIAGVERASMTIAVTGGVVDGIVANTLDVPIAGAQVTVTSQTANQGTVNLATVTDSTGHFQVVGVVGSEFSVRVLDPSTGLRGFSTGTLNLPNGFAHINVLVMPAGLIRGTVLRQDGSTAAGADVQVTIYAVNHLESPLGTTLTDSDGKYEFPLVTLGSYAIDATASDGNRGRSNATVAASGEEVVADITYLGQGKVIGTVFDGSNQRVPNANLTFQSESIFGVTAPVTRSANLDGTFVFDHVLVGSFQLMAVDPVTSRAAATSGAIASDGQVVQRDLHLAASGSLAGTVFRHDGTTTVPNAIVSAGVFSATTDAQGRYSFPVFPLGSVTVSVSDPATRGKGAASGTLATQGQTVTIDVQLLGQGTVVATVQDGNGAPAAGATVTVFATSGGFNDTLTATTGSDGTAVIEHVLAGTLKIGASKAGLNGTVPDRVLAANEVAQVTIRLASTGSITGTVFAPNGSPQSSGTAALVRFNGLRWLPITSVPLASDGSYHFDGLTLSVETPAGSGNFANTYQLGAYDSQNHLRALQKTPIALTPDAPAATRNLTFVGVGTVSGRVLNPDSSGAPKLAVQVRSTNPDFGGFATTTTNAAGFYQVAGLSIGDVLVSAGDVSRQLLGEASGAITTDGQVLTVDVLLKPNSVFLPLNLHDASDFAFDLQRNGSLRAGTAGTFSGTDAEGGMLLDVIAGGDVLPFTGSANGRLEDFSREVRIDQDLAGLNVTRKLFVPKDGYFGRYLELFTNPTADPITVDVRVTSHIRATDNGAIVTTSSGDNVLDVSDAAGADRWLVFDDQDQDPFLAPNNASLAFTFDGASAPDRVAAASSTVTSTCSFKCFATSHLSYQWNSVTVAPGTTVAFLHFVTQQTSQAGAEAAAARLVQLPPEALAGLSLDEIATIRNFAVPANGASSVPPLESLAGTVTGQVLEGDGSTPVKAASVFYKSSNPLYGRTYKATADQNGRFTFPGTTTGVNGPVPIPESDFTLFARHPQTLIQSPSIDGSFIAGEHTSAADVPFSNAGLIAGRVRRHTGQSVLSGTVEMFGAGLQPTGVSTTIAADGSYQLSGVPAGAKTLTASVPHVQGTPNQGSATASMTAGQLLTVDLVLTPTGGVAGFVRAAGGAPSIDAPVTLSSPEGTFTRTTFTDSSGRYQLGDAPVGIYTVTATDPFSFLIASATVIVAQDQTTAQDLSFDATGTVSVQVNFANGTPAADAIVEIQRPSEGYFQFAGYTDPSGHLNVENFPASAFVVRAHNPGNSSLYTDVNGVLTSNGQVVPVTVMLPGAGAIAGTVTFATGAAAGGAQVILIDPPTGGYHATTFTDATGHYSFTNLALNVAYIVKAFNPTQSKQFRESANQTVTADSQTLAVNLTLPAQATLRVTVKRQDGSVFAGALVQLKSAFDFGFFNAGTTNASGVLSIPNVGEGAFAVQVPDSTGLVTGTAEGTIAAADQGKTIDVLITTGVGLPAVLLDGNSFRFDIQEDGRLSNGSNDAYRGAEVLTIVAGGVSQTFTGTAIGKVEDGGREIVIDQAAIAGLDITRKIFVPSDGYFGRYLEVLKNTGTSPVTVDVKVGSKLGSSFTTEIAATSSGDTTFSEADSWLVTDDDHVSTAFGDPSLAFVLGGAGASRILSAAQLNSDDLSYRWNGVTVPPGGTVILMHFAVQQRTKASAIAAAERLAQIPAEAIAGLSADERARIENWQVPADGTSTVPPLAPRGGTITGQAFAGDGVTVLKNAPVTFLSPNSLMLGGNAAATTDTSGRFTFSNVAVDTFTLQASDPLTSVSSLVVDGSFASGQTSTTRDVVFSNTGVLKGTVRKGTTPAGATISTTVAGKAIQTATNGTSYLLTGLPAGTYTVLANAGGSLGTIVAQVTNGQATVADITTGSGTITGVVRFASGTPAPNARVSAIDPSHVVTASDTFTNASGVYTLSSLAVGTAWTVNAVHPAYISAQRSIPGTVLSDGQAAQVNVTLPALATARVTVVDADGVTPLSSVPVLVDRRNGQGFQSVGLTNAAGQVNAPNVFEPGFTVQASDNAGVIGTADGTVAVADDNGFVNVTITATALGGTVVGNLFAADGATQIPALMTVELVDAVTGQVVKSQFALNNYGISASLPIGHGFKVRARSPIDPATVVEASGSFGTRGQVVRRDLTFAVAVVRGTVKFHDGVGVPFPNLTLTQTTGPDTTRTWFASRTDNAGGYGIVVLSTGDFTLTAQDSTSGLTRTAPGSVTDLTAVINLDVTLPESGSVSGTLTNASGQPVSSGDVWLAGVGAPSRRQVTTDSQGKYRFDHVGLTAFRVQGCEVTGLRLCAAASGVVTSGGTTVNLAISQPGLLNGTIFADSGGAVVGNADISLFNRDYSGPVYPGGFSKRVFGGSDGRYSAGNLPAGSYTVTAQDYASHRAGIATGVLTPGGTSTIDVTLGNAAILPLILDGATNGFRYDIGCDGSLQYGGQPALGKLAFYGGASILSVSAGPNGTGATAFLGCYDVGRLATNNRGVTLENGTIDAVGVEIVRKIFVPEGAEFGRYLEVLTNRTSVDLTVRLGMFGRLAMSEYDTSLAVRPADTGNTVSVFEDASASQPSVGFVFAGQGAPVAALPTTIAAGTSNFKYEWVVTVPAGQTRSILHFVVQGPASGAAAVGTQSFALAALTDPNALAGLTAEEKASIVNFVIH